MTQSLNNILKKFESQQYATERGKEMHALLQNIVIDEETICGDEQIVSMINNNLNLKPFFVSNAKTEVPIAGKLNGVFISRRIDRLVIDNNGKTIRFLDYKSDTDKNVLRDKYVRQLKEYAELLRSAYPDYKIAGFILWLHDWQLDEVISL